jgi:hypothetical protein
MIDVERQGTLGGRRCRGLDICRSLITDAVVVVGVSRAVLDICRAIVGRRRYAGISPAVASLM